jgi:hypothetical protein
LCDILPRYLGAFLPGPVKVIDLVGYSQPTKLGALLELEVDEETAWLTPKPKFRA